MKNKALVYAGTAILLGVAMMLAPWVLVRQGFYIPTDSGEGAPVSYSSDSAGRTLSRHETLERMISLPNLASAGWMIIPSFLVALGAFLYIKKRMP